MIERAGEPTFDELGIIVFIFHLSKLTPIR